MSIYIPGALDSVSGYTLQHANFDFITNSYLGETTHPSLRRLCACNITDGALGGPLSTGLNEIVAYLPLFNLSLCMLFHGSNDLW
jgi:hypothetical protein